EAAHAALRSGVIKRTVSAYHLDPAELGSFDFVVCGSLMLHLRDPIRALEQIRAVTGGQFMSIEEISLPLTVALRHRPVAEMRFDERRCQWWVANQAGHRRMLEIAGFEIERALKPFNEPFGAAHPVSRDSAKKPRTMASRAFRRAFTGSAEFGVPHSALLARPRLQAPPAKL